MTDFSRLSANWIKWSTMAGMRGASVFDECEDCDVLFLSDDESIHLRHVATWWAVDSINDRGRRYNDIALLSTYDLVEKFLIWRWGSLARTVIGAKQLGAELHAQGPMPGVKFAETSRNHYFELSAPDGAAVVSQANATVFSHVMCMSVDHIETLLTQDIE